MATVEKAAEFSATVGEVFNLIADISRWPEWMPPLTGVSNISGSGMGTAYEWEFKLGPLPTLKGTGEVVKFIPNRRLEVETQGLPSRWLFKFSDRGGQALVHMTVEYDIPGGGVASGLVSKQIEDGLGLLRGLLES